MSAPDASVALPVRQRQAQNLVVQRTAEDHSTFDAFTRPDRPPFSARPTLLPPDFRADPLWSPEFTETDQDAEGGTP